VPVVPSASVKDFHRFRSKINKDGPVHPVLKSRCWLWVGGCYQITGYGQFGYGPKKNRQSIMAHRFSMVWILKRNLKRTEHVLHHCDNPPCVRPNHLFIGTEQDNKNDMVAKGRSAKGQEVPQSKLKEKDILIIRASYQKPSRVHNSITLGKRYKVHPSTINRIVNNKRWKHLR